MNPNIRMIIAAAVLAIGMICAAVVARRSGLVAIILLAILCSAIGEGLRVLP